MTPSHDIILKRLKTQARRSHFKRRNQMNHSAILKARYRRTILWPSILAIINPIRMIRWHLAGKPIPAPGVVKQMIVKSFANRYSVKTFVETGTYYGDMLFSVKNRFDQSYSIELSTDLFRNAEERFRHDRNVTVMCGDSGKVLQALLPQLQEPCLFWLDAHYSGGITAIGFEESPIALEIDALAVRASKPDVILIDDARCFNGTGGYPTANSVTNQLRIEHPRHKVENHLDIIRVYPNGLL